MEYSGILEGFLGSSNEYFQRSMRRLLARAVRISSQSRGDRRQMYCVTEPLQGPIATKMQFAEAKLKIASHFIVLTDINWFQITSSTVESNHGIFPPNKQHGRRQKSLPQTY